MGRRSRIHYAGAIYHAMARGVDGREIFSCDDDREAFLRILGRVASESGAEVIAYCLMGNHFHLAVKVGRIPLSSVMQRVLTCYSSEFNRKVGRTGHLFQARYKAILCVDEPYLFRVIQYIHMNPVKAGLVPNPTLWPWSSAPQHEIYSDDLTGFDPWRNAAEHELDLMRDVQAAKPDIEILAVRVAAQRGISLDEIRSKRKTLPILAAKGEISREAIKDGCSLAEIARWLNTSITSIARFRDKPLDR